MEKQLSKFESLQKIGHRFFVRHPQFMGEGMIIIRDGKYFYESQFSRTIVMTEDEVINLLK